MLRPTDTATRERKSLAGLWRFRLDGQQSVRRSGGAAASFKCSDKLSGSACAACGHCPAES